MAGAAMLLARLVRDRCGAKRALPSGVVTKTNRAGELLNEVGPNFMRS